MDTDLTIAGITTLAGAAILVSIVVEVIIRTLAWDAIMQGRFGPLLAIVVGVVCVTGAAAVSGADIPQGVLTGVMAGATAMGLHGLVTSAQDSLVKQPVSEEIPIEGEDIADGTSG